MSASPDPAPSVPLRTLFPPARRPNLYSALYITICLVTWFFPWGMVAWLATTPTSEPFRLAAATAQARGIVQCALAFCSLLIALHLLVILLPPLRRWASPQMGAHVACLGNLAQGFFFWILLSVGHHTA